VGERRRGARAGRVHRAELWGAGAGAGRGARPPGAGRVDRGTRGRAPARPPGGARSGSLRRGRTRCGRAPARGAGGARPPGAGQSWRGAELRASPPGGAEERGVERRDGVQRRRKERPEKRGRKSAGSRRKVEIAKFLFLFLRARGKEEDSFAGIEADGRTKHFLHQKMSTLWSF